MLLSPVVSHPPALSKSVPVLIVQEVTPQNQPSHCKNLAAAVATAPHCEGCAVRATVLQFAFREERKDTDVLQGEHPQCINEHAPKPLWHLQFSWEHSSFTQARGFYPEQHSDLRGKKDAWSLCTFAGPIFAGWLQVQSNMEQQNTVFLIKRKKYTHGTASGGFLKLFQGQMKRLMAPSWGAAAPSSIDCQHRQPEQGGGCW